MKAFLSPTQNLNTYRSNAETIKKLNETKQYTLMATGLLESIVTDPRLTASAAKLWEYLYTKAIMNENLSVKIRYKDLAATFNRSERTIKRHVESLKENDYLHVESNFHWHGQGANTFYLKIPQVIIENLNNTKDRKKLSKNDSPLDDKIVTPGHDTNVTLNNNIKKDIILNNNIVVVSSDDLEKNTPLKSSPDEDIVLRETPNDIQNKQDQQKIDEIESEVNLLYIKMGAVTGAEKMAIFDKIRQLRAVVSSTSVLMNQRKQAQQLMESKPKEDSKSSHFIDPGIDFSNMKGERELSTTEMARIRKSVEKLPKHQDDTKKICNEVIYAVRFGALRLTQNGTMLSVPHAISIALKLLREDRWETPAPMKRKEKTNFYFDKRDKKQFISRTFTGHQHVSGLLDVMNAC